MPRRQLTFALLSVVFAAGVGSISLSSSPAHAKAPMVHSSVPGYYRIKVGSFEVTALSDGTDDLPCPGRLSRSK